MDVPLTSILLVTSSMEEIAMLFLRTKVISRANGPMVPSIPTIKTKMDSR